MHSPPEKKLTVLEEIHATRRKLLDEAGGIAGLAKFIRQRESSNSAKLAIPPSLPQNSGRSRRS
jgi:hypothetical protein